MQRIMKKPPSLTAVSGRTCPHCLIIIDPVYYGWHVGKCSSKKLASTVKQDMPIKNEEAGNSHFAIHVLSNREAPTLAPDSQIGKEGVSGGLPSSSGDNTVESLDSSKEELHRLKEENQALKKDLKLKFEENEALNDKLKGLELKLEEKTDKVKSLELKLEDLELWRKLSEEAKKKEWLLLESSHDSSREKNEQGHEECVQSQPLQSINIKVLGLVKCLGADPGDSNDQFCHKQVDNVKEKFVAMDSAKSDDLDKRLDLDRIVDLACGEGAMSSHVEGVVNFKEAVPSTVNTSRKQRILSGVLSNASNDDFVGKSGNPRSTELGVPILQNEVSRTEILEKVNGDFFGKTRGSMTDAGAHGLAPEMQHHAVDTSLYIEKQKRVALSHISLEEESDLSAKQKAQSHASSATTEPEINAVKAKSGFRRRMVLQSDSESESGNIQGTHSGRNTRQAHVCDSKKNALPSMSSDAEGEKSEGSGVGFRLKNTCTSGKARQTRLRRSKRLNVAYISDQSDDAIYKGENEQSNHRSAEAPRVAATDLESVGVDGITHGELTGVRRSKRLRKMSIQNPKNRLQKESMCAEKCNSSGDETSGNLEGSEVSKSGASASIHSVAFKSQVKRKGPSGTRKRLFEDVESRPLHGNRHSSDNEEDDSEIESDADSLAGFITDSEGRQSSGYASEHHSSSSSYSSREVYRDPRLKRDIKIKNYVWELEGEMLSMLATDPKLCLRAVCALNRRQTEDEQKEKISKYTNKRGFDTLHAARGSFLAEFLTDGDISGPVKKSLADLDKFDAGGLEFCKMLASKHSKQLFEMYTNAEDPHFPFS